MNDLSINWIPHFKDEKIYLYGLENILKKIIQNIQKKENLTSVHKSSKYLKINKRCLYYWLDGNRPIPLNIFLTILKSSDYYLKDILDDIKINLKGITTNSGAGNKLVKIPFKLDNELAYLVGYLFGDGCLKSKEWAIQFCDEYYEQIKNIQKIIEKLFNIKGKVYRKTNKTELLIYSKAIWLFFNKLFDMPFGKKGEIKIPKLINDSQNLRFSFVKGFIDADGGICRIEEYNNLPSWIIKSPQIEVSSKSKTMLEEIKIVLENNELKPRGVYFNKINKGHRLILTGKRNMLKCKELEIFNHPIKMVRLDKLCSCLSSIVG